MQLADRRMRAEPGSRTALASAMPPAPEATAQERGAHAVVARLEARLGELRAEAAGRLAEAGAGEGARAGLLVDETDLAHEALLALEVPPGPTVRLPRETQCRGWSSRSTWPWRHSCRKRKRVGRSRLWWPWLRTAQQAVYSHYIRGVFCQRKGLRVGGNMLGGNGMPR